MDGMPSGHEFSKEVFSKGQVQKDPDPDPDVLFKALSYGQRKRVADFLDIRMGDMRYWVDFAECLEVPEDTIAKIEGGPANRMSVRSLFTRLKQSKPTMKVNEIIEGLKFIGRNDIVNKMDFLQTSLSKNLLELEDRIWQKLISEMAGQRCWKDLAHHLGFTFEEIRSFENRARLQTDITPTREVIDYLTATRPTLTLLEAKKAAEHIKRYDLAEFLNDILIELKKSKNGTKHDTVEKK